MAEQRARLSSKSSTNVESEVEVVVEVVSKEEEEGEDSKEEGGVPFSFSSFWATSSASSWLLSCLLGEDACPLVLFGDVFSNGRRKVLVFGIYNIYTL